MFRDMLLKSFKVKNRIETMFETDIIQVSLFKFLNPEKIYTSFGTRVSDDREIEILGASFKLIEG